VLCELLLQPFCDNKRLVGMEYKKQKLESHKPRSNSELGALQHWLLLLSSARAQPRGEGDASNQPGCIPQETGTIIVPVILGEPAFPRLVLRGVGLLKANTLEGQGGG
jgi:hypothetical protein